MPIAEDSFLYLLRRELVFVAPGLTNDHCSLCAGLLIADLRSSFRLDLGTHITGPMQAALVAPGTRVRLQAESGAIPLIYLFDPDTHAYRQLAGSWQDATVVELPGIDALHMKTARSSLTSELLDDEALVRLRHDLLQAAVRHPAVKAASIDPRIADVIARLRQACPDPVALADLAAGTRVSDEWLRHLFRQQTGLSIKRFQLWLKVRKAVWEGAQTKRITDVAMEAGFADSAHLSRTIHDVFGLWPSSFLRRHGVAHRRSELES